MHWDDSAILLSATAYGETSAVVRVFSRAQGVSAGLVRGGMAPKRRALLQPGNRLQAHWSARLENQLGSFTLESEQPVAALVMAAPAALLGLQLACQLLLQNLPEHHPYPHLYDATLELWAALAAHPQATAVWLPVYALWEMTFVQEMGFALDLSECAATGVTDDLIYISPKSGRAVSRAAGEPYAAKLLPFPALYRAENPVASLPECLDALKVSGYFLEHWLLEPHGRSLPLIRRQLLDRVAHLPSASRPIQS